jgi:hypothetical protein
MTVRLLAACSVVVFSVLVATAHAQRRYELIVEGTDVVSQAERTPQRLVIIDARGNATEYARDRRFDPEDRGFSAYFSAGARQILRWPASDRGNLQIADLMDGRPTAFRRSRMTIRPLEAGGGEEGTGVPGAANIESRDPFRLVSAARADQALGVAVGGRLTIGLAADDDGQAWLLTPLDNGYYRIHSGLRGRRWSLSGRPDGLPRLERTARDVNQLWQVMPIHDRPGCHAFACAGRGRTAHVLTVDASGVLSLQQFVYAPSQMWLLRPWGGALPTAFADYRFVSRELRPNPPLEPALVEFVNSHSQELWVLVADRRNPAKSMRLRIPAGKGESISLVRDAGGTLVEVYEYGVPGLTQREELATPLPPGVRYDVSVYELALQSIAIDRTVPGGKLENVNYSPKSVGWFALAPGPELESGPLDVFQTAGRQKNAGAVRRIDPSEWQPQARPADPVESLLDEFRKRKEQ